MSWRGRSVEVIQRDYLRRRQTHPDESIDAALSHICRASYPFGERRYWPYKVWLRAISDHRQFYTAGTGRLAPPVVAAPFVDPNQIALFDAHTTHEGAPTMISNADHLDPDRWNNEPDDEDASERGEENIGEPIDDDLGFDPFDPLFDDEGPFTDEQIAKARETVTRRRADEPAFARDAYVDGSAQTGLTARQWFIGKALQGLLAGRAWDMIDWDDLATHACALADAALQQSVETQFHYTHTTHTTNENTDASTKANGAEGGEAESLEADRERLHKAADKAREALDPEDLYGGEPPNIH